MPFPDAEGHVAFLSPFLPGVHTYPRVLLYFYCMPFISLDCRHAAFQLPARPGCDQVAWVRPHGLLVLTWPCRDHGHGNLFALTTSSSRVISSRALHV